MRTTTNDKKEKVTDRGIYQAPKSDGRGKREMGEKSRKCECARDERDEDDVDEVVEQRAHQLSGLGQEGAANQGHAFK